MRSAQITIKDIAKQLGISVSTVSRALKNHPDISEETRIAVQELAKKLNYKPNAIALSLLNSKSFVIGVIIPEIVHHFFSSVISGIEDVASKSGYRVMICQSNESFDREVINTHTLLASRVDGMIVSMTKETVNYEHFKTVEENKVPMVFFDRICPDIDTDRVIVNDYEAAFNAVEHLIHIGRRRIAHFAGPQNLQIGRLRLSGYMDALKKNRISISSDLIIPCDDYTNATRITQELVDKNKLPDAIFAVNDMTAIGILNTLKRNNISVPNDIAIVGFTNGFISMVCEPALTTIEQNGYLMGQKAAVLLIDRIQNKKPWTSKVELIPTKLVIRESTVNN